MGRWQRSHKLKLVQLPVIILRKITNWTKKKTWSVKSCASPMFGLTSRFYTGTGSSTCNSRSEDPERTGPLFVSPQSAPEGLHGTPRQTLPFWSPWQQIPLFLFLLCFWSVDIQEQKIKSVKFNWWAMVQGFVLTGGICVTTSKKKEKKY